ncbi:hypothetical protein ACP4OV_010274 [Aristida adscensionis]
MARSAHHLCALLLCAAAAAAFSGDAAATTTYSFPAFDATTTDAFVVATNSSVLGPASLIFLAPPLYPQFNRSEGFLLLSDAVDVWRAGAGGVPAREASFRTSFTLDAGAGAVAFAVLLDRFPPANAAIGIGLRGAGNYTSSANAAGELAAVEVGTVASYGPTDPAVGLNVTVTPNATAPGAARAVWVQYDAAAHRLSVFVAGAGEPRPARALLDAPLGLAGRRTTETAFVGFFAAKVGDIVDGVRDWELTVDRFAGGRKGTPWWVVLLAVLGSAAAAAGVISAAAWYLKSRRRRWQLDMEPKI